MLFSTPAAGPAGSELLRIAASSSSRNAHGARGREYQARAAIIAHTAGNDL
jgi:hypothetical protein